MNREDNATASSSSASPATDTAKSSASSSASSSKSISSEPGYVGLFRAGGRLIRWLLTHGLPMYAIVGTLLALSVSAFLPSILPLIDGTLTRTQDLPSKQSTTAVPVPGGPLTPSPGVSPSPDRSAAPVVGDPTRPITEIAKLALDTSKDRIEGMKENYDKLFAMIAAFAALLGFLGFKGFESFAQAKARAEETVAKADSAVRRAEDAHRRVTESIEEHTKFRTEDYPNFASAELYLAHGIIMREIAEVYEVMGKHLSQDGKPVEFVEKVARLQESLTYLERSLEMCDRSNNRVRSRALGTLGNVRKRLDDHMGALSAARGAATAAPNDPSAYYNVACYAAMVAEDKAKKCSRDSEGALVSPYVDVCLDALSKAVKLHAKFASKAMKDADLSWVRDHPDYADGFKSAATPPAAETS